MRISYFIHGRWEYMYRRPSVGDERKESQVQPSAYSPVLHLYTVGGMLAMSKIGSWFVLNGVVVFGRHLNMSH